MTEPTLEQRCREQANELATEYAGYRSHKETSDGIYAAILAAEQRGAAARNLVLEAEIILLKKRLAVAMEFVDDCDSFREKWNAAIREPRP